MPSESETFQSVLEELFAEEYGARFGQPLTAVEFIERDMWVRDHVYEAAMHVVRKVMAGVLLKDLAEDEDGT